jgi:hypothetical protein
MAGAIQLEIKWHPQERRRLMRIAATRTIFMAPRDPSWFYYPGSAWSNLLFQTGYEFG